MLKSIFSSEKIYITQLAVTESFMDKICGKTASGSDSVVVKILIQIYYLVSEENSPKYQEQMIYSA